MWARTSAVGEGVLGAHQPTLAILLLLAVQEESGCLGLPSGGGGAKQEVSWASMLTRQMGHSRGDGGSCGSCRGTHRMRGAPPPLHQ